MGWSNVFNCEWEEFPRQVLKHHFPNAIQHGDIKELDATAYAGRVDILTGGFPCQPYSLAGKRKGKEDDRHLWPEMLRVIRECSPTWVVGENVRGLVNWSEGLVFDAVCTDLESEGYEVVPCLLPAAGVGAPHKRDRIWFVAYTNHQRNSDGCGEIPGAQKAQRLQEWDYSAQPGNADANQNRSRIRGWEGFPDVAPFCGGDDGLSKELDGVTFSKWRRESIKAYGNAIVPQVALQIFKAINEYENGT